MFDGLSFPDSLRVLECFGYLGTELKKQAFQGIKEICASRVVPTEAT